MTDLELPPLTQEQRKVLLELRRTERETKPFLGRGFHGTTQRNLKAKGLVQPFGGYHQYRVELTDLGRRVAELVEEEEIERSGRRLVADAKAALRRANSDIVTPPQARPGHQPQPVRPLSAGQLPPRAEGQAIMEWLNDPARRTRLEHLRQCGHRHHCSNCRELWEMFWQMELALINMAGEVDLLKQKHGYREEDLRRTKAALASLLGFDTEPAKPPPSTP